MIVHIAAQIDLINMETRITSILRSKTTWCKNIKLGILVQCGTKIDHIINIGQDYISFVVQDMQQCQARPVKWHKNRGSVTKKQLWSRHTNFCKKSHENLKFLLLGSKSFCKAVLVCLLRALKTSISLGTWFLYRIYQIRKPSVSEMLHSLFIYTPVRDDPNDNRCTYNIDKQYCLMLNILGDTSFSGIKLIYWFCVSKVVQYLNILLPLWNNY